VIESFRHKGLKELFETGRSAKVPPALRQRSSDRMEIMDAASDLIQLNLPGYNLHPLHTRPERHSIHVNGPWCITFEWRAPNASKVDLEQYH
jgi:proteic killer suppression protein